MAQQFYSINLNATFVKMSEEIVKFGWKIQIHCDLL